MSATTPRTPARRAAIIGVAVAAVYLAGAFVSGTLNPLARRPLLDGAHTAPYNWVTPPPGESGSGQPAGDADHAVTLPAKGLGKTTVPTTDKQLVLDLPDGAVPAKTGKRRVQFLVKPLDATTVAAAPEGFVFRGNAYQVAIRYSPGGEGIATLAKPGQLTMVYAAPTPSLLGAQHTILFSKDGTAWTPAEGVQDQHATQQVTASFSEIGYYAVAAPGKAEPVAKKGKGFPWVVVVIVLASVGVVAGSTSMIVRKRSQKRLREQRRAEYARRSRSTKKRRR